MVDRQRGELRCAPRHAALGAATAHGGAAGARRPELVRARIWDAMGFWRLLDCLAARRIAPTLAINGAVCEAYPRIWEAAKAEGWEFMGHGWLQGPMHGLEDQRISIRRTIEAIRSVTSSAPRGWEAPGLRRRWRRWIHWPRRESKMSLTGSWTTSQPNSMRRAAPSSRCLTRSNSTMWRSRLWRSIRLTRS
jgi:peptidoglycan/xylan/chitin deacetylase (PgdA/CDA1 family)